MCLAFGNLIDIMTQAVPLGEENLGEMFLLIFASVPSCN
jgi:hypothetical protein